MKRVNLKSCDTWTKAGYTIYENDKLIMVKHYNQYGRKNYIKEIGECLYMLVYGIISIIGFPFVLIYTLLVFIPKIYIKDETIDKQEQEDKDKTNEEIEEIFKEKNNDRD